ncbi:hypothetical protein ACI48J_15095 [Paenibacillus chitinolyticus]|uniref:hypothetical protein n=1 Tax=Paenibacillus chitinolyticus TaxID=79263 RepID=UPI00386FF73D
MENPDKNDGKNSYSEIINTDKVDAPKADIHIADLTWFEEEMTFETIREAEEWVYSDAYNKIGHKYDGYKTTDPKLAYALLYHLVRAKTLRIDSREVLADEQIVDNKTVFMVWVPKS